jgi:CRISPR-associated endoribonuclease Cas6
MTHTRLYAVVLRLAALRPGAVPANHGDQARAAFMHMIRAGDAPLAEQLHDTNIHKPYTISLLHGGRRARDGAQHFGTGDTADWRFTLLSEPTFEAVLRRYLLDRKLPHVRIGAIEFTVTDVFASGSHPDSGSLLVSELVERWQARLDDLPRDLELEFWSPTVFSLGQDKVTREYRYQSLPEPRTLMSSLRKRAEGLGLPQQDDSFDTWIGQTAQLIPLDLGIRRAVVEKRVMPGFVGRVRIQLGNDTQRRAYAHMLGDLAFWTGVGYQTTRGLGQVRRINRLTSTHISESSEVP